MRKLMIVLVASALIVGIPVMGIAEEELLPHSAEDILRAMGNLDMCANKGCWQCCNDKGCTLCCICFIEEGDISPSMGEAFNVVPDKEFNIGSTEINDNCDSGETDVEGCD